MKREFLPIGKYPVYNNEVDRLMVSSEILNSGSIPNAHTTFWDKTALQGYLSEIVGEDEKGFYMRNNEWVLALKPSVLNRIQEIEQKFNKYKQERKNLGYECPEEMPIHLLNELYKLKAHLSVLEAEANQLRSRLQKYVDEEEAISNSAVLTYGLQCAVRCHGLNCEDQFKVGTIREIDGQKVSVTHEGLMIIDDKRSPYSGMLVSDYRKLAEQWRQGVKRKEDEAFRLLQESYREQGLPVPQQAPVKAPKTVSRKSLPPFPAWAKKYET